MKQTTICRSHSFLPIVSILIATALPAIAQSPQTNAAASNVTKPPQLPTNAAAVTLPSPGVTPTPQQPPPVIQEEKTEGYQIFPLQEQEEEEEATNNAATALPSPGVTPAPSPSPPAGQQPGAPVHTPSPTPTAVHRGHQHRKFPFFLRQQQQQSPAVIEQEETEGYQIFPSEAAAAAAAPTFPAICVARPGYGPGECILFPPTCGYQDVWTLFYLDKNGELCFAFPMSENIWGTGDWFGIRHTLVDHGVNIIGSYATDIQGNVTGGMSQGFAYADCIDLRLDLDMQKLVGWKGAHLVFSCLDRNGKNLSKEYIGNQFTVGQIWGCQTFSYYALWLDQNFLDEWWNIKLGRIAATDDFTSNPLIYGLYVNNAIDGQPQIVPVSGYLSAYPAAVWGSRLRFNDKIHNLYAMFGVYQTSNRLYKPQYHGADFSIRPYDGINLVWEVGWIPEFQPHPLSKTRKQVGKKVVSSIPAQEWHGMLGHYKFGAFYTPWKNIPQFYPERKTFYSYGFYWLFDQMVYQAVPGTNQGLTLWTAFIYAPQENTSRLIFQASGGAIYTGLIPRRSRDQLALGIFYGTFSKDYANTQRANHQGYPTYELVLEAGYRINLAPFFYIQPDIQYVIRPGGTGRIPNALVIGTQIGFAF